MVYFFLVLGYFLQASVGFCQFTHKDSLRGSLNADRSCYDVHYYNLTLKIDTSTHSIAGNNQIYLKAQTAFNRLQIDLFDNLVVDSIKYLNRKLHWKHAQNAVLINFPELIKKGDALNISFYYHGIPHKAINAPWEGGFVWAADSLKRPWIGVSCEGIGASLWWPNKDHLSDEPDSMGLHFEVPDPLYCVSNGILTGITPGDSGYTNYHWKVNYPINNYNITFNLGSYTAIHSKVNHNSDSLSLDYYVLDYHKSKAAQHFRQVIPILNSFSKKFGSYPFVKDGYALVETSYLGMEHQGCISYGNEFINNVYDFDFIILHETAHEWWGNSVSVNDHAEMWIHEAFATYSEALFIEDVYDYKHAITYLQMQKQKIKNKEPMLGPLGVNYNQWSSSDIYYKGTWLLHTLRNVINNDSLWFGFIHGLAQTFEMSPITTPDVINYLTKSSGTNYSSIIEQYIKFTHLPVLEYYFTVENKKTILNHRWKADVPNYEMAVEVLYDQQEQRLHPTSEWAKKICNIKDKMSFKINSEEFYCEQNRIK